MPDSIGLQQVEFFIFEIKYFVVSCPRRRVSNIWFELLLINSELDWTQLDHAWVTKGLCVCIYIYILFVCFESDKESPYLDREMTLDRKHPAANTFDWHFGSPPNSISNVIQCRTFCICLCLGGMRFFPCDKIIKALFLIVALPFAKNLRKRSR